MAKTAKRALKTAKSANKTAKRALNSYGYVKTIQREQEVAAAPGTFADFEVNCPTGYTPTGHGAGYGALDPVAVLPTDTGYIASMSNLGGLWTYSGNLYVICALGDTAGAASAASVKDARRRLERSEARARAAAR